MINLVMIIHVLAAAGVIGLVLLQHGKGADMGASFGSGASGSLFGVSGSSNFLSRATAICVAVFFATAVAVWFSSGSLWLSWMYGAMTVVIPAALFARGLTSRTASVNAMAAALGFMVWQGVKWMVSVMFLVLAPRIVPELSWPALLAGLIVTMKVYWLALIWGKSRPAAHSRTAL